MISLYFLFEGFNLQVHKRIKFVERVAVGEGNFHPHLELESMELFLIKSLTFKPVLITQGWTSPVRTNTAQLSGKYHFGILIW